MVGSKIVAVDDSLVAFAEGSACRLARVSQRQLRYWTETALITPSIAVSSGPAGSRARLYAFDDLLALLVASELRRHFSLQHIRKVVAYLQQSGYVRPLAEVRFAIEGQEIFFQHADGSWEGDRRPGQVVLSHVVTLEPLRHQIRSEAAGPRRRELRGKIEQRRKVHGSKPVFSGTRTPVEAVFPYLRRRYSTDRILEAFPHLSREDVRVARSEFAKSGVA